MTYAEAVSFLETAKQYGSVLGLDNMRTLLKRLGNPENKLKFIHIAGTNGKGSTAAYISNILAEAGYLVGRYISPSVFHEWENIQITGKETVYITESDIQSGVQIIKEVCDSMVDEGLPHPTLFEIETALSFLYFVQKQCDLVVLEVGLGGRLDATNVIETTLCAVITSISMDHMHILGDSLEQIAYEKAGIIKKNIPVISYDQEPEARKVIESVCKEKNAFLTSADFGAIKIKTQNINETVFIYENEEEFRIKLLGENQVKNAVVAIMTVKKLNELNYKISPEQIHKGLYKTAWRGRFELIKTDPIFMIDGAHNEDAAISLAENIKLYFPGKKIQFIMGVLADKDYDSVLRHTGILAEKIITITPNNPRALESDKLSESAKRYCKQVVDAKTVKKAVQLAYETADKKDVIIAFGSLSYLKEIYEELGVIVPEVGQGGNDGS
jgi:dihydrofolate synthase / folylpolyglutamate synthase